MLVFKVATEEWEFDEIHKLNYKTFVEEIPQHAPRPERALVDKFHQENDYIVCTHGNTLVGMITVRGKRPFSLDQKLPDLDELLPPGRSVCEIRLLAVQPEARNGIIFKNLMDKTAEFCLGRGFDMAVISGTTRQLKLYRHIGFVPFGPLVGTEEARYQPMYLTLEAFRKTLARLGQDAAGGAGEKVNLLPGPVEMHDSVRAAIGGPAVSTRAKSFTDSFDRVKSKLLELSGARNVEIFLGSGTLANDAMVGQLSLIEGRGLVLSDGEFGERLVDHAERWRLDFTALRKEWGERIEKEEVREALSADPGIKWLLFTHCETSTGILHDLDGITEAAKEKGAAVAVDCISSFATVPLRLDRADFATSLSGKAVGAYPGLSFVFYNGDVAPQPGKLPRYLDLGRYAQKHGIPYTTSSNLFAALDAALSHLDISRKIEGINALSREIRREIEESGLRLLAPLEKSSPAVFTIVLPEGVSSGRAGDELAARGYLVSYMSEYLLKRNWIQICLLGELKREEILKLPKIITELVK